MEEMMLSQTGGVSAPVREDGYAALLSTCPFFPLFTFSGEETDGGFISSSCG